MANDRDCENCKHHREVRKNGKFYRFCESWDCGFEPKEGEPFEPCEDCISRDELLKAIDTWDKFGFEHTGCFVREPKDDFVTYVHYDDVVKCIKGMPSVNPEKPRLIDPAYEKTLNKWIGAEVLDRIRNEITEIRDSWEKDNYHDEADALALALRIIDKYAKEGKA